MTIIAFDGTTVAADRQVTDNGLRALANKLFKHNDGTVLAIAGDFSLSLALKAWYEAGKPEGKCPCTRDKDNFGSIVVFKPDGTIEEYENCDTPVHIIDPFMAWGSGRNYATTALALGKSAEEAVELACRFNVFCGLGTDSIRVRPPSVEPVKKVPESIFGPRPNPVWPSVPVNSCNDAHDSMLRGDRPSSFVEIDPCEWQNDQAIVPIKKETQKI